MVARASGLRRGGRRRPRPPWRDARATIKMSHYRILPHLDDPSRISYIAAMISAILLAAGRSSRFGEEKLLQLVGGKRLVDWSLESLLASVVEEIVVVCSVKSAGWILPSTPAGRLRTIINPSPEFGMSSSIQCGIGACSNESEAALMAHADMPLIDTAIINAMATTWKKSIQKIVVPRAQGRQGNPVIIPRKFWPEILELRGEVGCKSILGMHSDEIEWVEFEDDRVLFDVDSTSDLVRWKERWKK